MKYSEEGRVTIRRCGGAGVAATETVIDSLPLYILQINSNVCIAFASTYG